MPICFVANNVAMLFWKLLITVVLAVVYYSLRKIIRLLSCKSLTIRLHFLSSVYGVYMEYYKYFLI